MLTAENQSGSYGLLLGRKSGLDHMNPLNQVLSMFSGLYCGGPVHRNSIVLLHGPPAMTHSEELFTVSLPLPLLLGVDHSRLYLIPLPIRPFYWLFIACPSLVHTVFQVQGRPTCRSLSFQTYLRVEYGPPWSCICQPVLLDDEPRGQVVACYSFRLRSQTQDSTRVI